MALEYFSFFVLRGKNLISSQNQKSKRSSYVASCYKYVVLETQKQWLNECMQIKSIQEQVHSDKCILSTSSESVLLEHLYNCVTKLSLKVHIIQRPAILTICWRHQPHKDSLQFLSLDCQ